MLEELPPIVDIARVFAGLGVVTVCLSAIKRSLERRRWLAFKSRVVEWLNQIQSESEGRRDLDPIDWTVSCQRLLEDSGHTPHESKDLLELAEVTAQGIAAERFIVP